MILACALTIAAPISVPDISSFGALETLPCQDERSIAWAMKGADKYFLSPYFATWMSGTAGLQTRIDTRRFVMGSADVPSAFLLKRRGKMRV